MCAMECFVFAKVCHHMLAKPSSNELHFLPLTFFEIEFPTWGLCWPWTYDPCCLCCPRDEIIGRCHKAWQRSLMTENVYVSTVISCKLLHHADMNNFSLYLWKYSPDYRSNLKKKPDKISKCHSASAFLWLAMLLGWPILQRLIQDYICDFYMTSRRISEWVDRILLEWPYDKKIISGFWIVSLFFFTYLCKQLCRKESLWVSFILNKKEIAWSTLVPCVVECGVCLNAKETLKSSKHKVFRILHAGVKWKLVLWILSETVEKLSSARA